MRTVSKVSFTAALAVLFVASPSADAAQKYSYSDVEKRLEERYPTTSINAEGGVVTQGVTLTLKKVGLNAGSKSTCVNDYKDGKITLSGALSKGICGSAARKLPSAICLVPTLCPAIPVEVPQDPGTRPFARGETLYVTRIEVTDTVALTLVSDPINNVTYKAVLHLQPPKGSSLDFNQADQLISEVFTSSAAETPTSKAQPASSTKSEGQSLSTTTEPKFHPIEEPKAPTDAPAPEPIRLGMSIDQVVAILGQPAKLVDLDTKKIYSYPKLKVTFVNDKVSDVD
jgi:hypothetical protein